MRITPAYAGKTMQGCQNASCLKDHPRLRGENHAVAVDREWFQGSPPPTRGKLKLAVWKNWKERITPAYAGKTLTFFPLTSTDKDHPRLRGENLNLWEQVKKPAGSPPPTRGKPLLLTPLPAPNRITPAYAGKTLKEHVADEEA